MSKKNTKLLSLSGFTYGFHASTNKWRCTLRNNKLFRCNCNLRAEKSDDGKYYVTDFFKFHNHGPDAEKLAVSNALSSIKEAVATSNNLPCQILQTTISTLPENIAGCLPSKSALTQMIKREKKKQNLEKEPESIHFVIPLRYQQINGGKFVFGDIIEGDDRLIILTTNQNLIRLRDSEFWMMDGTFKVVPTMFFQLYTIHCSIGPLKSVHPMVYVLMSGKSTALYEKMFSTLNEAALEIGVHLDPKFVITDFEKAAINSIRTVFENITVKGCNFHFMQNVYKQIQKIGWQTRYGEDVDFALKVRQIAALSFLEPEEIPDWFKEISAELGSEFYKLTDWLNEYYVSGKNGRSPLFPPNLWSVCEQNKRGIPRTQNYAESFHRYINTVIGRPHIGVFNLIAELQKKQPNDECRNRKNRTGKPTLREKNKIYK